MADRFTVIDPATEEVVDRYDAHTESEVERRVARAAETFRGWREIPVAERARRLLAVAVGLGDRKEELARLMTREMGKPIGEARSEVDKCAWVCEFYAERAPELSEPEPVATDARESFVRFDPLGPVLAIMPWNFPFWQVMRFAAPALAAGNVGLLKHASNVPGCALAIERLFADAGFPPGAFQTLLVGSGAVEGLLEDERIRAATLTGSEPAGMAVAETAGRNLKKTVLELGGSDPFVVLADADLESAAKAAATARTINSGQSCIAAKRFIVEAEVAERFEAELVRRMEALTVGNPLSESTDVGPLAREDLLEELEDQVARSLEAGATLATGGRRPSTRGFFYQPTVLSGVEPGTPAFDEEIFGPVAAVIVARDRDHAIELANRSPFGLGASIWTGDPAAGRDLAARVEAGCVFVNEIVKSDPRLPFGGVKRSGYGRELGVYGLREFVNVKTVWVA